MSRDDADGVDAPSTLRLLARSLRRQAVRTARAWRVRLERPRWVRPVGDVAGRRVCLLVGFSHDGTLPLRTRVQADGWKARGFVVVVVVACNRPRDFAAAATTPSIDGLLVRGNVGYDFGSWRAGLRATPGIADAALVALANDSVYGPLAGFDDVLARVDASPDPVVGLTDSFERVHHLQSYCVFYKDGVLKTAALRRFWRRLPVGGRADTIVESELSLLFTMRLAGLGVDVLFPADPRPVFNPTLATWRELVDAGFPFVKVQLLRDNPAEADLAGWPEVLGRHSYDPSLVVADLGERYAASAAARADGGLAAAINKDSRDS